MTSTAPSIPGPARATDAHAHAARSAAETAALRLAFAGGGTGGHLVPGLHVLAAARARGGAQVEDLVWFTSGRAVEERVLARLDEYVASADAGANHIVAATEPRVATQRSVATENRRAHTRVERVALVLEPEGGGAPSRSTLVLRTPRAVSVARRALVAHRSEVLLALGGFTGLPAVLAARSLGIPVALLEVNAHAGAATRWLARFAQRVFHAWPVTHAAARGNAHVWTGPPLAPEFTRGALPAEVSERARAELGFDPARPLLAVLGGSQGAAGLNTFVRVHGPALLASGVQVLHQTGPGRLTEALPALSGYRAVEYVDPAWRALAAATVVLCRGGASTLAEVAALRRPAFVVPYPHHKDQHQEKNARELGAGVEIVPESALGLATRDALIALCAPGGAAERARRSDALARAVPTDAAARIFDELCALASARRAG